ncbi:hypothetical protein Q0Z83_004720 [Actinoplanes sichuanensis]|nr:hypothetical protein Q0Z83_004720 [Actinoplanes sichuanensis]
MATQRNRRTPVAPATKAAGRARVGWRPGGSDVAFAVDVTGVPPFARAGLRGPTRRSVLADALPSAPVDVVRDRRDGRTRGKMNACCEQVKLSCFPAARGRVRMRCGATPPVGWDAAAIGRFKNSTAEKS